MSSGFRPRSVSAPVRPLELTQFNKYKDKRICMEDLQMFVDKYRKESKSFTSMVFGLPCEMLIIQNIVCRYKSLMTNRTPISNEDKEVLSHMISMNKEHRAGRPVHELRLRDSIIDRMITFFGLENEVQYESLRDYI